MASRDTAREAPMGHDWGEKTIQSIRGWEAPQYWKTDAYQMGDRYGITEIDVEEFREFHKRAVVYPDLIIHERNPTLTQTEKGTNALIKGNKKGCGKSTVLRHIARQMMHHNDERFVWRGATSRSEWLPFRKWTTLYLPRHATLRAAWMEEGDEPTDDPVAPVEDLEDVVRDVVFYDDLFDLLEQIGEAPAGTFNVVYPDPSFAGCAEAFARSERFNGEAPYTPEWDATESQPATPLIHWWYAFILARVDHGPFQAWCLGFDETGDILPSRQETKQDEQRMFDKVMAVRSALSDSRRAFFSWLFVCHYEAQLFDDILREVDWRIHMPDGSPNPVKTRQSSIPTGFDGVGMPRDYMSTESVGTALCYDQSRFTPFTWKPIPPEPGDEDRWLKIELLEPDEKPERFGGPTVTVDLEFDKDIFHEWENQSAHRLYVKDPGAGYVDVETAAIGEPLESPLPDLPFCEELDTGEGCRLVHVETADGEKRVVARIPDETAGVAPSRKGVQA